MLFCVLCFQGIAQQDEGKAKLLKSYEAFLKHRAELDSLKEKFDALKVKIGFEDFDNGVTSLGKLNGTLTKAKMEVDSLHNIILMQVKEAFKEGATLESMEDLLPGVLKYIPDLYLWMPPKSTPEVYTYFSKNQVIDNNLFKDDKSTEALIFRQVMEERGKQAYLGDVHIPASGSSFYFYEPKTAGFIPKGTYQFKKVDAEIRDGYFYDIVVQVTDLHGDTHFFSNSIGVSLLYFPGKSKLLHYLYSHKENNRWKPSPMRK